MSAFTPIPLGRPIPDSPHAVSCSLPTIKAVRGYEEKDPAITRHMSSGYPRFVVHPFSVRLAAHLAAAHAPAGHRLWLVSSAAMARRLAGHLAGSGAAVFGRDGVHGVTHPDAADTAARAKLFLQRIGGFISSREAEDHLVRLGVLAGVRSEALFGGDAGAEVRGHLRRALTGAADTDLFLANCGMNAVYAAFTALADLQAARGRTLWVQLGWLYMDTISILKNFTSTPADYIHVPDVFDRAGLERLFAEKGSRIAGVVAEIPSNPLIQTPDVEALSSLCHAHGARLLLDPSTASAFSVDILRFADVVVTSLTKYTAGEGDVIAGLVAVNPAGPDAAALRAAIPARLEPLYDRDARRLAAQVGSTTGLLGRIEANAARVASFLSSHPGIRDVFWALHPSSKANYARIARGSGTVGGMISFTLKGPLAPFYDSLRLPKGPSFGMRTTLICPFMYLAHYDLVTSPAGRAELAASGLDPDLLRLCVGEEPAEDIIAALEAALGSPTG
jgi:cystathionine gamma-synthase